MSRCRELWTRMKSFIWVGFLIAGTFASGSSTAQGLDVRDFDLGNGIIIQDGTRIPELQIDWSMTPRYPAPPSHDPRLVNIRNSRQYVLNNDASDAQAEFVVEFKVGANFSLTEHGLTLEVSAREPGLLPMPIRVEVSGVAAGLRQIAGRPTASVHLPEGAYTATVTSIIGFQDADVFNTVPGPVEASVNFEVEDIFIAVIGESYTAGEGAPAARDSLGNHTYVARWASGLRTERFPVGPHESRLPDSPPNDFPDGVDWEDFSFRLPDLNAFRQFDYAGYQNYLAHRSPLSTTSLAAMAIEEADPKTSVTYVSFAETGARIYENAIARRKAGIARIYCRGTGAGGSGADPGRFLPNEFDGNSSPSSSSAASGCNFVLSGDAIARGIPDLEPFVGSANFVEINGETVPGLGLPQVSQVMAVAAGRTIDMLVVGIGGNDTGFADLAQALGERNGPGFKVDCDDVSFAELRSVIGTGRFSQLPCADEDRVGLGRLHEAFADLHDFIERESARYGVTVDHIVLMGVPTPVYDGFDPAGSPRFAEFFTWIAGRQGLQGQKQFFGLDVKVDRKESRFIRDAYICPLNNSLANIAERLGYTFVHFDDELFRYHGIASGFPPGYGSFSPFDYRPRVFPLNVRLGADSAHRAFRPYFASMMIQGSFTGDPVDNRGVLHPNEYGYRTMAHVLLRRLTETSPLLRDLSLPLTPDLIGQLSRQPGTCVSASNAAEDEDNDGLQPNTFDQLLTLNFVPEVLVAPGVPLPTREDEFTLFVIRVTNWSQLSDDLFAPAPDLPPCGNSDVSPRTWVDIFDADTGRRLYGHCGLRSASNLQEALRFTVPVGQAKPERVRVDIIDRATGTTYTGIADVP